MFTVRTILATTAIAALTAFPVTALTLDAAADVQLNAMTDVEAIASTETAVATNDAAMKALSLEAQAFASNTVVSSDDQAIGLVQRVQQGDGGNIELIIAFDSSIVGKVKGFSIQLAPDAKADGTLKLAWTKADLLTTLDAQVAG